MPDLVVLGDCPVELWCRGPFAPETPFRSRVAGTPFQVSQAAVSHGLETGLVARLGDDLFEPYIRAELRRAGLDSTRCLTVPGPNGVVFSSGDRTNLKRYQRRTGSVSSGFVLDDEDLNYIKGSRWFCSAADFQALSGASQDSVYAGFRTAAAAGVRTAFTTGFDPGRAASAAEIQSLAEIAPLLEVAFVDPRQGADWLGTDDPERVAAWVLEQGVRTVVVRGAGIVSAVGTAGAIETAAGRGSMEKRDNPAIDASFLSSLAKGADPVSAAWAAGRETPSPAQVAPPPAEPPKAGPARADIVVYIDGGSRGNPGVAGAGVYFEVDGQPWRGLYEYLGHQTNNFAEYSALLRALRYSLENGMLRLSVCSDSELLVKQLRGVYRVKNPALQRLHAEAEQLIGRFERFSIRHVPREQNKKADALANRAQDEKGSGEEAYA
jgi:ribonuclease HI